MGDSDGDRSDPRSLQDTSEEEEKEEGSADEQDRASDGQDRVIIVGSIEWPTEGPWENPMDSFNGGPEEIVEDSMEMSSEHDPPSQESARGSEIAFKDEPTFQDMIQSVEEPTLENMVGSVEAPNLEHMLGNIEQVTLQDMMRSEQEVPLENMMSYGMDPTSVSTMGLEEVVSEEVMGGDEEYLSEPMPSPLDLSMASSREPPRARAAASPPPPARTSSRRRSARPPTLCSSPARVQPRIKEIMEKMLQEFAESRRQRRGVSPVASPSAQSSDDSVPRSITQASDAKLQCRVADCPRSRREQAEDPCSRNPTWQSVAGWTVSQYKVEFSPPDERSFEKIGLTRTHRSFLGSRFFDSEVLSSTKHLPSLSIVDIFSIHNNRLVKITLSVLGQINMENKMGIHFLATLLDKFRNRRTFHQIRCFHTLLNSSFPGKSMVTIPFMAHNKLILQIENMHRIVRNESILDLLTECVQCDDQHYKALFKNLMNGASVKTYFSNRIYRVTNVDFNKTPQSVHESIKGMSFVEYYKEMHQINIREVYQPMLVVDFKPSSSDAYSSVKKLLVPELCSLVSIKHRRCFLVTLISVLPYRKRFSFKKTGAIEVNPPKEGENICSDGVTTGSNINPSVSVALKRVFSQLNSDNSEYFSLDASYRFREFSFQVEQWTVMYLRKEKMAVIEFVSHILAAAEELNVAMSHPRFFAVEDNDPRTYIKSIELVVNAHNPQIILIVPSAQEMRPDEEKCSVDHPEQTQKVPRTLVHSELTNFASKVAEELHRKFRKIRWLQNRSMGRVMFIGLHSFFPRNARQNFTAIVVSMDEAFAYYFSEVWQHSSEDHFHHGLARHCEAGLLHYFEHNGGSLPDSVFVYRDGAASVLSLLTFKQDAKVLYNALATIYLGKCKVLKLFFIVVAKTEQTQMLWRSDEAEGREEGGQGTGGEGTGGEGTGGEGTGGEGTGGKGE